MRLPSVVMMCALLAGGVCGEESTITVNGTTIRGSGNQITVNGAVIVDGTVISGQAAGGVVKGSGKIATVKREVGLFSKLNQNMGANVTVRAGTKARCTLTADENILPLLVTEVVGDALRMTSKESYQTQHPVEIEIETPFITRAEIAGAGRMDLADVLKDKIQLVIHGSGDIRSKGQVAELEAHFGHFEACLHLLENRHDLTLAESTFFHRVWGCPPPFIL